MLYFILILLLMNVFNATEPSQRAGDKAQRRKPFAALVFSNTNNLTPADPKPCQWLRRLKHQSKACWERRGLAEVLLHAKNLSVSHCRSQFEFEQWNCTKTDFFFRNIYRETAFMYSMASSAVMFSVAKACAEGTLAGCQCAKPNSSKFRWGGCNDNTKFAKRFTKKFLQLRKKGDTFNAVVKYNSEVGIKVVVENEENFCRCHGVSGNGSCQFQVCTKRIRPFEVISKQLRALYHNASQLQPENKIGTFKVGKSADRLLFLENSPNWCPKTVGRLCLSTENCATVCCGRKFDPTVVAVVNRTCDCRWRGKTFEVDCEPCTEEKQIFRCK